MRMTALDIQNHRFPRKLKGYDVDEVEQFRSALVEDFESLSREAEGLRGRVRELEKRVEELTTHEEAMRDALVTAQGISGDLRRTAEREAQMMVSQAELRAEKILDGAQRQVDRLSQDVRELRSLRSRMAGAVRAAIDTHTALLEGFTQDVDDDLEREAAQLEARTRHTPIELADAPAEAQVDPLGDTPKESAAPAEPAPEPTPIAPSEATGWTALLDRA